MASRLFVLGFSAACASPQVVRPTHHPLPQAPAADDSGAAGGADGAGGTDTAADPADTAPPDDSAAPTGWLCPAGAALVPASAPYCVFQYEAAQSAAGPVSGPGLTPWVGISFLDAQAACTDWQPVADDGRPFGEGHLVTRAEWVDAGDAVPGPGGPPYPWGEEPDASRCWLPDASGNPPVADTQLTGTAPACVSALGVYDQLGNAWEWVDPQATADAAAWSAAAAAIAPGGTWSADGGPIVWSGPAPTLVYGGVVLHGLRATPDEAGVLTVDADGRWSGALPYADGFLQIMDIDDALLPARYLPVRLVARSATLHEVHFVPARATEPFTAKVGGAWYAGSPATTLIEATHEHPAGFNGTIGFRCAIAALPL